MFLNSGLKGKGIFKKMNFTSVSIFKCNIFYKVEENSNHN